MHLAETCQALRDRCHTGARPDIVEKLLRGIVEALDNPVQQKIVADDREQTNVLVLAGPGSGKTRVLVHRIAYLIRVRREDPRGILVLAYNRHAAAEIRARLRHLIGEDAGFVTVSTCHALAIRLVIAPASARMKAEQAITVDRERRNLPSGGPAAGADPVGQGCVQVLQCAPGAAPQAVAAVDELLRLSRLPDLVDDWSWSRAAIISRDWKRLGPARAYAEAMGIPVEMANETLPKIWRLREMQNFVAALRQDRAARLGISEMLDLLNQQPRYHWIGLIAEGVAALAREIADKSIPVPDLVEWFAEWARDTRGEQRGLLLLTAHRAKGLEFDDVAILDSGWDRPSKGEDADAPRRLFYVAMTRARCRLAAMA